MMMPTLTIVLLFLVYALQIKSQTPEKAASQEAERGSEDYQSPPQLSSGQQEDDVEAYESADPNKRENEPKPKTLEYTKSRRMKSRSKRHGSQNAYFQDYQSNSNPCQNARVLPPPSYPIQPPCSHSGHTQQQPIQNGYFAT